MVSNLAHRFDDQMASNLGSPAILWVIYFLPFLFGFIRNLLPLIVWLICLSLERLQVLFVGCLLEPPAVPLYTTSRVIILKYRPDQHPLFNLDLSVPSSWCVCPSLLPEKCKWSTDKVVFNCLVDIGLFCRKVTFAWVWNMY